MARESCIAHQPRQILAIIRQDYYQLLGQDACGAALLNIFEYWANAAIAQAPDIEHPWVGARPIREFEQLLLGIATDKQIRKRLILLEQRGFIATKAPAKRGAAKEYQVKVPEIQAALVGQITEDSSPGRSNNRPPIGQITEDSSVKQPKLRRSNDRALKKDLQEKERDVFREKNIESSFLNPTAPAQAQPQAQTIQVGVVAYGQPPETIDLSDQWATNPGWAKSMLRLIAPQHRRLELVAHGLGHWWIGPGLNDFDPWLIKACQARKRKLEQSAEIGDAKTYLNNLIMQENWANLALRCDEARVMRDRAIAPEEKTSVAQAVAPDWSAEAQRDSVLGLARFKVARGQVEQAIEVAGRYGISKAEIGLVEAIPG